MTTHPIASSDDVRLPELTAQDHPGIREGIVWSPQEMLAIRTYARAAIASHTAQDKAVIGDQRAAFEKAAASLGYDFKRGSTQPYTFESTNNAFKLWKLAASPQLPVAQQKAALAIKLEAAIDYITNMPHGDNCFVSDHYEGDPGARCNCGKDNLLEWLEFNVPLPVAQLSGDELGYAQRLATAIWEKHYVREVPGWKPFDNLAGVLTQIDNMTCRMTLAASHPSNAVQDAPVAHYQELRSQMAYIAAYDIDHLEATYSKDRLLGWARSIINRANLSLKAATVPQVAQSVPSAYARKWHIDGETPTKVRNDKNRLVWPTKFKWLPVTPNKILSDDVPLFAPQPIAASPSIVPSDEQIIQAFRDAGMNFEPPANMLYSVRGQIAQLLNGTRALLTTTSNAGEAAQGEDK